MADAAPNPNDVVAWIAVRLHAHGHMSVSGTIGDPAFAKQLLEHGKDAITRQVPAGGIVIPNRDVEVVPESYLRERGDMAPADRGDS